VRLEGRDAEWNEGGGHVFIHLLHSVKLTLTRRVPEGEPLPPDRLPPPADEAQPWEAGEDP
jgi:hypothetical protein